MPIKGILFLYEKLCTKPRFHNEVHRNSEMAKGTKLRVAVGFSKMLAGRLRAVNHAFPRTKTKGIRFSALQKFEVIFHERKVY